MGSGCGKLNIFGAKASLSGVFGAFRIVIIPDSMSGGCCYKIGAKLKATESLIY